MYFHSHFLCYIHTEKLIFEIFYWEVLKVFLLSFVDNMATGTYNFASLIEKVVLLELTSLLSAQTVLFSSKFS